jgi:hypothetical protein
MLRYLAKWREAVVGEELIRRYHRRVLSGPFKGMIFTDWCLHGSLSPQLLGIYERELHGVIEAIVASEYRTIINIGAADGYYAVGLALRMPRAEVFAHETLQLSQVSCCYVAEENNVSDRVTVAGEFRPEDFARFSDRRTVVICDIEGGERDLLDPEKAPALSKFDVLVECHDSVALDNSTTIAERFAATHEIERVEPSPDPPSLPHPVRFYDEFDQFLARWEWRVGPTPWLWMRARR